uniref:Uncharacterized protein n=3 Tax=unclassified bacterial viruses TaxID=12333 RepID=A0AAU6W334_9VIRU
MTTVNVMFSDEKKKEIIAVFGAPQSEKDYANLGAVEDDDSRYLDFLKKVSHMYKSLEKKS